jgi:hypothetical protein
MINGFLLHAGMPTALALTKLKILLPWFHKQNSMMDEVETWEALLGY